MDESAPAAEAMLVRGDRIAAIGSLGEVEAAADRDTRRVDLEGQAVIPGFNDAHCHILSLGQNLRQIDVSADAVRAIGDVQRAVRERAGGTPLGEWVLGRGYDQNMLAERRHPTRQELDEATDRHPVVLWHTSGHVLTANSLALERAGITAETDDPPGGVVDRDEHGEPTGLLKESAMELIGAAVPRPDVAEGAAAIREAMSLMGSFGITGATDAATGHGPSAEPELAMYRRAAEEGLAGRILLLPQIVYVAPPDGDEACSPSDFDAGSRPEWLAIEGTKIFSDGAMSTRTAAMREAYAEDPSNHGILLWPRETLVSMMCRAHAAGWQIATHALGDRAVEVVLDCYAEAMSGETAHARRHRIEHCMVCDEDLGRRIRELGIVPVLQPDIFRLGDGYITALGLDRAEDVIPMRVFESLGIRVALSSDAPVVPCDPLLNICSAVERVTPSGVTLGRHHAIPLMEAIRLYTAGAAYATHTDNERGRLRPGYLADFAVLSHDPATLPTEDMAALYVTTTVVGGRVSYRA
jgi:predicted amidohydrolase YtcJ